MNLRVGLRHLPVHELIPYRHISQAITCTEQSQLNLVDCPKLNGSKIFQSNNLNFSSLSSNKSSRNLLCLVNSQQISCQVWEYSWKPNNQGKDLTEFWSWRKRENLKWLMVSSRVKNNLIILTWKITLSTLVTVHQEEWQLVMILSMVKEFSKVSSVQ